jgi:hypothetical protein
VKKKTVELVWAAGTKVERYKKPFPTGEEELQKHGIDV